MAGTDYMAAGMNAGLARGKQDLLLHLLANLPHSILLLGAQGSGKTALLRQLQGRVHENWRTSALQGGANLSFERVIEEMLVSLPRATATAGNAEERLDEQLSQLGKQGGRLVLLLDDAGLLMPGLLAAICQFVRLHPEVRLVFSLRPEELAAKSSTDALALADAHRVNLDESAEPPPAPPKAQIAKLEAQTFRLALTALLGKPLYWLISGGLIAALVSGVWVGSRWQASPPMTPANPPAPLSAPATAAPTPVPATPTPSPTASPLADAIVPPSTPAQGVTERPAEPLPTPTLAPSTMAAPTPTAEPTPAASPVPTAKPMKKKPAPPRPSEAPKRASEAGQAREAKKTESKPAAKPKPSPAPKPQDEKPVSLRKLLDEMDKP